MSDSIRQKAEGVITQVEEVTAVILPEPADAGAIVHLAEADAPVGAEIRARMDEIDMTDTNSIVAFGSSAQAELQVISQSMLTDVRNKDVGPAGDSLRNIVTTIRGFSVSELDVRRDRTWWERLLGRAAPFAKFTARFETVQHQIDKVTDDLLGHEHKLLKDIKSLDLLYEKTLQFYDELALYIAAGEEKLEELDNKGIPAREAAVQAAPEGEQVMKAQELRDLRAARDDLERRVHDLKLTRQVTMQSLPSIRLVQENDKSLVTKINSTLVNTVPLWETQLAQAVTIQRSAEAAAAVRSANDLTNELLTSNAANLRESNKVIRQEMERGVFDIEAVKQANADLIGTIEESLQIADDGKAKRAEAEAELKKMEAELRDTLAAAKARKTASAIPPEQPFPAESVRSMKQARDIGMKRIWCGIAALACLSACEPLSSTDGVAPKPAGIGTTAPNAIQPTSEQSAILRSYLAQVQSSQLTQGLLRQDGGGPDTPFTADMLARNFERIVFYNEYTSSGQRRGASGQLRRWATPVRMAVEFGASVPPSQQAQDRKDVSRYARRLARVTRHPVSVATNPNFLVLFVSEDDRAATIDRISARLPGIDARNLQSVRNLPDDAYCAVVAFAGGSDPSTYSAAVAVIRAENPDLLRLSCIHEELAQGLGLANDSPDARPSIFNDDDEFALLTDHDELLLGMLYDPRLKPGMSLTEASPIVREIAGELRDTGGAI